MCGICGFWSPMPQGASETLSMLSRMEHRGPDAAGILANGRAYLGSSPKELIEACEGLSRVSLGHTRLEIMGEGKKGVQPFSSCRGKLWLSANGEIYNHEGIRAMLDTAHDFKGASDNEVVLHLIEEMNQGDLFEAVRRVMPLLDGMYAFAVTDGDSLVLARDAVGKKPLYFHPALPLTFASERKAFQALEGFKGGLRRLTPGHALGIGPKGLRYERVLSLEAPPVSVVDRKIALEGYRNRLQGAIEKRLYGLNRVGVLFSGGIDSVVVARALQMAGIAIQCYCVGKSESLDMKMAPQAADALGLPLKTLALESELSEGLLKEIVRAIELAGPIQVEAAIPMYLAARMCSQDGIKVMFTGQGADELFAGYSWYNDVVYDFGYPVLQSKMWEDIQALYQDTLEREDRMAMAHGIELRAPFLDGDLMRFVMQIAPTMKIHRNRDPLRKRLHRELARLLGIPESVAFREKVRAQDGTGVRGLLYDHARGQMAEAVASGNGKEALLDFGSNYRYVKEPYAPSALNAYLGHVSDELGLNVFANRDEEAPFSIEGVEQ